jgi:hypothetical protein
MAEIRRKSERPYTREIRVACVVLRSFFPQNYKSINISYARKFLRSGQKTDLIMVSITILDKSIQALALALIIPVLFYPVLSVP